MEETSKADIRRWDQLFLELETLLPFLTWVLLLHLWAHLPFSEVTLTLRASTAVSGQHSNGGNVDQLETLP